MKQDLQTVVFEYVKSLSPKNVLPVAELETVLNLSRDSVYRRVRGQSVLSASELFKLARHYNFSIDEVFQLSENIHRFQLNGQNTETFDYTYYLKNLCDQFAELPAEDELEILVNAKDIPIFYHFIYHEIAEFKGFFWSKTVFNLPEMQGKKFSCQKIDPDHVRMGNLIYAGFANIRSVEIWSTGIFNSLINQIQYYSEAGFFASENDKTILLDRLERLINHIEIQVESGYKRLLNHGAPQAPIRLYHNEIVTGKNTVVLHNVTQETYKVYYAHNVINTLSSDNQPLAESVWQTENRLINNSTLISVSSVKERAIFFQKLREKVQRCYEN